MRDVFISHSAKDKNIVKYFIDDILVGSINILINEISCSSIEGTKIESGDEWRPAIRDNLNNAKIVFLIITTNYKSSEICLNEMGAAWALCDNVIPLIVEPINYESVGVLMEVRQIEKIADEGSLDRVKDKIQAILKIPFEQIKSDRWTAKKKEFLIRLGEYIEKNPFPHPVSESEVNKLLKINVDLNIAFKEIVNENEKLKNVIEDLKKLKDARAVETIKIKHGLTASLDIFRELAEEVKSSLLSFDEATIAIIYQNYSGNSLSVDMDYYESQIEKAIARGFIDGDYEARWRDTKEMRELNTTLSNLKDFIEKSDEEFWEQFNEHYNVPLDIDNLSFWEEIFECKISTTLR